jgi:tetratricopeptide (TPR) repeat protein
MNFICPTPTCAIALSKASLPVAMNCPVCQTQLEKQEEAPIISAEDETLISSLPYVIAYPLRRTLAEKHMWTKVNLLKDTFLNYLKYLGLLAASEFFNSNLKDKKMVALFQQALAEPSFGSWNQFIRETLQFLKEQQHVFFCAELVAYYDSVETGKKRKLYKGEIEYIDSNGDVQLKKQEATAIGMLINFRNRYLGHGLTLDEKAAQHLWNEYFPLLRTLLEQMQFASQYAMFKHEHGETYKMQSAVISTVEKGPQTPARVWLHDAQGRSLDIIPFYVVPGEVSLAKDDKEQILAYESYTGKTIKFFSPEGTEKQSSGKILEKLNLLLRDKQKEKPYAPDEFTKEIFIARVADENKLILDTLIAEKKVIPGVYVHREDMEIKLREWIGARMSIFFIAAEAGSGKTNLLVEMQKQYTESGIPTLLIRAGRMEKQTLREQLAYLLNIDATQDLSNYKHIAGAQASPTMVLIDGLNEAAQAEALWKEVLDLSKTFESGSLKFVLTSRANSKADIERYVLTESDENLFYGENNDHKQGLGAYTYWLTSLNMAEMKNAWDDYVQKDKNKFKPQFSFDDLASFDRAIYNQISNPLVLRLFLETYHNKALPKKGNKHLNIWADWLATFTDSEQEFFKLLTDAIWQKGENELLLDFVLKNENLKPFFTDDRINAPYPRLKNNGWISRYVKDLNGYIGFTVEAALLYLLGIKLTKQVPEINIDYIHSFIKKGTKLQKTAIESFLCEQALNENLELVINLIDSGNDDIDLSINPLYIYLKTFGVNATIEKVLENPTENDWKALLKLEGKIEELQLAIIRKDFLKEIIDKNPFNTKESLWLGIKGMKELELEQRVIYELKVDLSFMNFGEDADVLSALGIMKSEFGEYDKALDFHQKALSIQLKDLTAESKLTAISYLNIGTAYDNKGNHERATEFYQKGLDILLKTLGHYNSEVAEAYLKLGMNSDDKGEYDNAMIFYQSCLEIQLKILGSEHPNVADTYRNFGFTLHNKGDFDKAIWYYHNCLAIQLKILGSEHNELATTYNNIGVSWHKKKDFDKALEYYQNCLNIELKNLGPEHPKLATSYNNIGYLFYSKNNYDKALEFHYKSLNIRLRSLGHEHPDVAISHLNIGLSFDNKGDQDQALVYYHMSLNNRLKNLGPDHPNVALAYSAIGEAWKKKGEFEKALDFYKKCLDICIIKLGIDDERTKKSIANINSLYRLLNKDNELPEWMKEI